MEPMEHEEAWRAWRQLEDDSWERMRERNHPEARRLALKAIALEPDAYDCYVILAQTSDILGEKLAFAREAVRIGRSIWASEIEEAASATPLMPYEDDRAYTRALQILVLALLDDRRAGSASEAIDIMKYALEEQPNDRLGFRTLILEQLARQGRWSEGHPIIAKYPETGLADFVLWSILFAVKAGEMDRAEALLPSLLRWNALVPALLLRRSAPARFTPHGIALGSEEEATHYVSQAHDVWHSVPGAIEWLRSALPKVPPPSKPPSLFPGI